MLQKDWSNLSLAIYAHSHMYIGKYICKSPKKGVVIITSFVRLMQDRGTNFLVQFPWHSPRHISWKTSGEGASWECSMLSPLQAASHIVQLVSKFGQVSRGLSDVFFTYLVL